ncbi:MAG: phosphoribosylpyrophosphate synthetase [Ignavibacteria bacterium]
MKTLSQVMVSLKNKHCAKDFTFEDKKVLCKETSESFDPDDLVLEKAFRFEGDSSPDDMCVLYHLTSESGTNGMLIDAFGTYSNAKLSDFIKDVPCREIEDKQVL